MTAHSYKQQLFIKTLIDRYHSGKVQDLLRHWGEANLANDLRDIEVFQGTPEQLAVNPQTAISPIHYSWIAEAIQKLPRSLTPSLIASLGKIQQERICRQLKIALSTLRPPAPAVRAFLLEFLYKNIEGIQETLPLTFTPTYPLSNLVDLDREDILEIFDLLGLQDLAIKTRRIVDKKTLNAIYKSVPLSRKNLFNIFFQTVDKAQFPEIDLSKWSGDSQILAKILHRRGILRLAYALAGYDKDFLWHFTRRLDTGRGRIILRYYSEEQTPITPILTEQVQSIINIITKRSES